MCCSGTNSIYLKFFHLQAPDISEPESLPVIQRPAHLKVRKSSKKPSPSPTRRSSQPAPPPQAYSGSPVRMRKGSNPTTPTSAGIRPIFEGQPTSPTRYYRPPPTSPMLSSRRRSSSVQSRFAVSASYPVFEFRFLGNFELPLPVFFLFFVKRKSRLFFHFFRPF